MASKTVETKILEKGSNILSFVIKGENGLYRVTVNKTNNVVVAEELIKGSTNINTIFGLPPQELNESFGA